LNVISYLETIFVSKTKSLGLVVTHAEALPDRPPYEIEDCGPCKAHIQLQFERIDVAGQIVPHPKENFMKGSTGAINRIPIGLSIET